jgi:phosphocarrier protein HPr
MAMSSVNMETTEKGHRATVTVNNSLGLHLRPASQLVKLASTYNRCDIEITKDGQTINAKSIMGVIMLAAEQGSDLTIEARGEGSSEAVSALVELVNEGFGET